jgi:putative membrane-bound dehydrogenase-like protein
MKITAFLCGALLGAIALASAAEKKIVLIAGNPSHPPGMHEFRAGCLLLQKCLAGVPGVSVSIHSNGWPKTADAFEGADAVVIYADGGGGHPAIQGDHKKILNELAAKGVGLGFMHYGVEIPSTNGGPEFLEWIGGYYEDHYSVNPMWSPQYEKFAEHPVTRGVKPFSNRDEWYFNMRWREDKKGITPILVATPSDEVRKGPYVHPKGPYDHIVNASGREETLMWVYERPNGGRGFGFTGGHTHANWGNPNQRKVVLNALLWIAKAEVPSDGVESAVSNEDLKQNLDPKGAPKQNNAVSSANVTNTAGTNQPPKPLHTFGPEAAKDETARMTPADGLQVQLFASEPMVVNLCDMDIDARGRVWVTEGANYRSSFQKWGLLRPEGDRIVIVEDTNGDGAADKAKTFYQDPSINAALGICVLGNKVIVSCSPYIFVLTDTDGDDVADKRDILFFTHMRSFDHDHSAHAFVFGPDGKLYFNFGNAGVHLAAPRAELKQNCPLHGLLPREEITNAVPIVDVDGNRVTDKGKPYRQGMVFRCDLDGSNVEVLGHNFRNNYEVAVDSFGTLWQSDNDDDGNRGVRINYVMEHGNFGYVDELKGESWGAGWKRAQEKGASESEKVLYEWHQYDPGVVPNLLHTGQGSPTGITMYEGKLLPRAFQNQVIHCDAGPRVVRAYPVTGDGAGYSATISNVLTSPDNWYRPSDVCVAPDGSLFVADWHDAGVGGHNMADKVVEFMTGRIYRVAPQGAAEYRVQKFDFNTPAGCVSALQSPNNATRYLAWTALNRMQGTARKELENLWGKNNDPRQRARALQLLARIKGSEKKYVEAALKDKDLDIRITGLRAARMLKLDVISYLKQLSKDSSPHVRRECALALRHNQSSDAPKLWARLATQHDGKDRWYLEALGIGADQQEEKFFAAWLNEVKGKWNTPGGRDIVWRSRASKSAPLLVQMITAKQVAAADKDRYMRALDYLSGPEREKALEEIAIGGL